MADTINLKEASERFDGFSVSALWLEYGINGMIPTVQLEVSGLSGGLDNGYKDFLMVVIDDKEIIASDVVFTSITYNHKTFKATFIGYLIPEGDINFLYGRSAQVYRSNNDVIDTLWKGTIDGSIPIYRDLNLCQMRTFNHLFLTDTILSSAFSIGFYYGVKNNIVIFDVDKPIEYDFEEESDIAKYLHIQGDTIPTADNKYYHTDAVSQQICDGRYGGVDNGDKARFYDKAHEELAQNITQNTFILNKQYCEVPIDFFDTRIVPSTKIAFRFSQYKMVGIVVSVKIYLTGSDKRMSASVRVIDKELQ